MATDLVTEIAEAIADGSDTDWPMAECGAASDRDRALIGQLRTIAEIAQFHNLTSPPAASSHTPRFPILVPPVTWGSLHVHELVGSGRFGDVYRAWDPSLDREVALKLLAFEPATASDVIDEGRLAARVRHQNVVAIYGAQRIDGRTGLWMELVNGRTLEAELAERGPFDGESLTRIAGDLCDALQAVHDAGLVHRDVKTTNVMRDVQGRVVLGDFGTGRELEDPDSDRTGLAGTPAYLAPEIFDRKPATPRSDLYSLGVLLFRLAVGRFPVGGTSIRELRAAHSGVRTSLSRQRPDLPARLTKAVDRALDPDPARRFSSAAAMKRALVPSKTRTGWIAAAIAIVATAGSLVIFLRNGSPSPLGPVGPAGGVSLLHIFPEFQKQYAIRGPAFGRRYVPCAERNSQSVAVCDLSDFSVKVLRGAESGQGSPRTPAVISPDGRSLAYVWEFSSRASGPGQPNERVRAIRVISLDGTKDRQIYQSEGFLTIRKWTRTGDALVVTESTSGSLRERVVSLDGSGPVDVWRYGSADRHVDLSPDGTLVVVARAAGGRRDHDLIGVDLQTGQERWRLEDSADDLFPRWTPDGRGVVFARDADGAETIMLAALTATGVAKPVALYSMGRGRIQEPVAFSADGALFMEVLPYYRTAFVVDVNAETGEVGQPRPLDRDAAMDSFGADWGPGGRVAYLQSVLARSSPATITTSPTTIVIRRLDGGIEQQIPVPHAMLGLGSHLRWKPDGGQIAVVVLESTQAGLQQALYLVDLGTAQWRTIARGRMVRNARWSADGNTLFFVSMPGTMSEGPPPPALRGPAVLRSFDARTGKITEVYRPADRPIVGHSTDVAPDGTILTRIAAAGKCVLRIVAANQPHRDINTEHSDCWATAWVGNSPTFLLSVAVSREVADLWLYDSVTGAGRRLALQTELVVDLSPSQDGRQLLYTAGNPLPGVWMLGGLPTER